MKEDGRTKKLWSDVWDDAEYETADAEELGLKYEFERSVLADVSSDVFLPQHLQTALAAVRERFVEEARRHLVERVASLLVPS